eukprot:CAMPEP_0181318702 /NCGR_PEP_ID=MMETSP1101-20121128/17151_1 /TAXON_ID=46948 /ORGANISM="Rhodomonas abbreviata, Strain Caron Lab Isolate" /LENGTH=331 /DNA_ID=CAMNT_0023426197 /DNA_START=617 /DNA_END=1609 /DNA_ORIENTATION=-
MALSAELCDYCGTSLDEVDEDARISCECKGMTVCLECFEGEDGIKESAGVGDSHLYAPFLSGEPGSEVVAGYGTSLACVECISSKQNIAFTPRRDVKGKGTSAKAAAEAARGETTQGAATEVDTSEWAAWADLCEVILEDIAQAGDKPNDVAKMMLWKSISRAPTVVIALARKNLSWTDEKGVWGPKCDWKTFVRLVSELVEKWKDVGSGESVGGDNTLEFIAAAKTKLAQVKVFDGKSARCVALHDFLVEAPAVVQNPFISNLGWCKKNGTFARSADSNQKETLRVLNAMCGLPSAPTGERLLGVPMAASEELVSLRDEGLEEEHLLRGG